MASDADLQVVIKHIVEGDVVERLCRICLLPLEDVYESVFTTICKDDREYCVADVLEKTCGIQIPLTDNFSVCKDCFYKAASVYEFYLLSLRSTVILDTYVDHLEQHILSIELPTDSSDTALCITLPAAQIKIKTFDFDLNGCLTQQDTNDKLNMETIDEENLDLILLDNLPSQENDVSNTSDESYDECDSQIITIKTELYEPDPLDSSTDVVAKSNSDRISTKTIRNANDVDQGFRDFEEKIRKKRNPMLLRKCSQCPVGYRFLARLKEHMRNEHKIHLFICKLCKATSESEQEFTQHLRSHREVHRCTICDAVFRRADAHAAHLLWHEETDRINKSERAHVCEQCGVVLANEEELQEHMEKKHLKQFTCHFCGRMYKLRISLENHIAKHENQEGWGVRESDPKRPAKPRAGDSSLSCETCGKRFGDRRALEWHRMLHTNDRPFTCDVCGRGFISVNRRNQHSLCAHTAPTRRCPLCPALFHLRSMVNTHIKKVHLNANKRRKRTSKHQNASWRTVTVPTSELSVELQHDIIELKNNLRNFESQVKVSN